MKLFTNKKKLQKEIKNINNIGFVPTMGSLHKGHENLIKKSVRESKKTIVSIFVNPKQFENEEEGGEVRRGVGEIPKTLKCSKIARIAPILTILGPFESS